MASLEISRNRSLSQFLAGKTLPRLAFILVFGLFTCSLSLAQNSRPVINKIDPPNWWSEMPDPMLLLHGENFQQTRFTVQGKNVAVTKTQISENGHWAFLWLKTSSAAPQMLHIHAQSTGGEADATFELKHRRPENSAFQGFSSSDVMYLIMTDRFSDGDPANNNPAENADGTPYDRQKPRGWHGGDLRGIENHIDYLKDLGITTLWTTPVYKNVPSPESYHGYGATDLYAIDPHFGNLSDYQSLSNALHRKGMKLVFDTVPNHVGQRHPWVFDPPTPDWFHGTLAQHFAAEGDFQPLTNPHATTQQANAVTHGWFANILPDLNQENPLVSQYLIQNSIWWIETAGLDGLRIDTFPFVTRSFWHDFHAAIHSLYPKLTTVGEAFNPDPTITSYFAGGVAHGGIDTGLDTPFDFPVHFALKQTLAGGAPMTKLAGVLRQDWLYPHPERLVIFLGNHDTMRFLTEKGATPAKLKIGFGLIATLRGMPQLYSGDEIAMTGGEDPDNRHDFPGGFPGDSQNAFTTQGRTPEQQEMEGWISSLLKIRKEHLALQKGSLQTLFADETGFLFTRKVDTYRCGEQNAMEKELPLLVAVNNSSQTKTVHISLKETATEGCTITGKSILQGTTAAQNGNEIDLTLAGDSFEIFALK